MQEAPIVELVQQILYEAIHQHASDIHIEPMRDQLQVRYRIDGVLHRKRSLAKATASAIAARFKIMADLDVSERRLPQDGRFQFSTPQFRRDCRLSFIASAHGEKIVVRILYDDKYALTLDQLGMQSTQLTLLRQYLNRPQGLIIVTGPTGSGKTITLYAALQALNRPERNITSIEDPIEIDLAGINQIPIQRKIGVDFARALRAILRQDPDIIMIGEIRDLETASMALRAAQTGHLVLSTLHTNHAIDSIARLIHMGIAPFQLASALHLVIAQRLIRKRCQHTPSCDTGYCGRTGVFELLSVTPELREMILRQQFESINTQHLHNHTTLWQAALEKMQANITDYDEIQRAVSSE